MKFGAELGGTSSEGPQCRVANAKSRRTAVVRCEGFGVMLSVCRPDRRFLEEPTFTNSLRLIKEVYVDRAKDSTLAEHTSTTPTTSIALRNLESAVSMFSGPYGVDSTRASRPELQGSSMNFGSWLCKA